MRGLKPCSMRQASSCASCHSSPMMSVRKRSISRCRRIMMRAMSSPRRVNSTSLCGEKTTRLAAAMRCRVAVTVDGRHPHALGQPHADDGLALVLHAVDRFEVLLHRRGEPRGGRAHFGVLAQGRRVDGGEVGRRGGFRRVGVMLDHGPSIPDRPAGGPLRGGHGRRLTLAALSQRDQRSRGSAGLSYPSRPSAASSADLAEGAAVIQSTRPSAAGASRWLASVATCRPGSGWL